MKEEVIDHLLELFISSTDWSRCIIRLIIRGYVKFFSGIHIASASAYPVHVTKNSLVIFRPT